MGNSMKPKYPVSKREFKFQRIIGRGGFGQVWEATRLKTKEVFAIKQMRKVRIVKKRSVQSVLNECRLLKSLSHPFLINQHSCFQDVHNVYIVLDLLAGGDLRHHMIHTRHFTQTQTRFWVAGLLVALQYLHSKGVVHRDVKPQNLVLDSKGYPRLTDLGVAKYLDQTNSVDTSGTAGYMAPEVMFGKPYGLSSDFFAVGVIVYELMLCRRPYPGKVRSLVQEQMIAKQVQLRKSEVPKGWSSDCADFTNKLLQRKPSRRLGFGGIKEVMNHSWFAGFEWGRLVKKELPAPFVPEGNSNYDDSHVLKFKDNIDTNEPIPLGLFDILDKGLNNPDDNCQ